MEGPQKLLKKRVPRALEALKSPGVTLLARHLAGEALMGVRRQGRAHARCPRPLARRQEIDQQELGHPEAHRHLQRSLPQQDRLVALIQEQRSDEHMLQYFHTANVLMALCLHMNLSVLLS